LNEAVKILLHLAHENGHVTYDDINDVLPDGMSPEDLDALYTKLRTSRRGDRRAFEAERAPRQATPKKTRKTGSTPSTIRCGCT
jgi:hypothetical protein